MSDVWHPLDPEGSRWAMSDVWHPLDPEGSRPPEVSGREQGPDPEPIVRTVRVAFLLAGMVVAVMVNAGLNGLGGPSVATSVGRPRGTGSRRRGRTPGHCASALVKWDTRRSAARASTRS